MVTKFFGGAGSETGLVYYDAAAKKIRGNFVNSGGSVFRVTLWPDGDNWRDIVDVMLPDGTRGTFNRVFRLVFTDSGNTWTIHFNGKVGVVSVNNRVQPSPKCQ